MIIRNDLNKLDKKEVYEFLKNESMVVDKGHQLITEKGFKLYFAELYDIICNDDRLNKYKLFKQKLWHFFNDDYNTYTCPVCGNEVGFMSIVKGYRYYCSNTCKYNDPKYIKKVSENFKKNWETCDKKIIGEKISNGRKNAWDKLTEEEKHVATQHMRNILAEKNKNRTEEDWKEINEKKSKTWKETYKNKSEEQKQIEIRRRVESSQQTIKNRSEEEFIKVSNNIKQGLANMSPENRKKRDENNHQTRLKKVQEMRPDVLDILTIKHNKRAIYTCKCTNPNCNKCSDKIYKISYMSYRHREQQGIEKCPICHPRTIGISGGEKEMLKYIKKIYKQEIKENSRQELGGLEIDVYLPNLKIGFEFQGDLWHANPLLFDESFVNPVNGKTYNEIHEKDDYKKQLAKESGIELIEIWESDWFEQNRTMKKYIKNIIKDKLNNL